MPRDKTESHERIVNAAFLEFMKYGFKDASMRRIAATSGMSASGLYKHFPSKEDMFAALIEPVYEELKRQYAVISEAEVQDIDVSRMEEDWDQNSETTWITRFIYQHFNAFKLLVCRSQGTRFENYIHELATLEEASTRKYIQKAQTLGSPIQMIPEHEYHLFVTSAIEAIMQPVAHDFTEEEALSYARHLDAFYGAGWKTLLGL